MSYTIKVLAMTFVSTILFNAIDFNSDGLIAINKPFGVPLMKNGLTTGHSESLFSRQSTDFSGIQTQCRKILPAKLVERFSRGIFLIRQPEEIG